MVPRHRRQGDRLLRLGMSHLSDSPRNMVHEVPPNQASGWKLGEHGSWCKHTNFDIDTRAPLIVRAPGLGTAGARTFGLTEFVDMYPTLCETCDLPLPDHLEGQSLVRLMEEPEREWKAAAFSQYPRRKVGTGADRDGRPPGGEDLGVMGYTMRTRDFRYTEWRARETGEVKARELYDHREDAGENVNAIERERYRETVGELESMLRGGWQKALATWP